MHPPISMSEFVSRHLCPQRLPLSGAVNFRDLGGYRTEDDRQVKRGLVFRSDHLSRLTAEDQQTLRHLRFKVVCDFRTALEQQQHPDLLPLDGAIRLLLLPVQAGNFDPALAMDRLRSGERDWLSLDFFINLYRQYLDDFGPVWGQVLRLDCRSSEPAPGLSLHRRQGSHRNLCNLAADDPGGAGGRHLSGPRPL